MKNTQRHRYCENCQIICVLKCQSEQLSDNNEDLHCQPNLGIFLEEKQTILSYPDAQITPTRTPVHSSSKHTSSFQF